MFMLFIFQLLDSTIHPGPVQKPIVFPEVAVCLDELEAHQFPCVRLAPQQLLRRFGENIGRAEQDVMLVANFVFGPGGWTYFCRLYFLFVNPKSLEQVVRLEALC